MTHKIFTALMVTSAIFISACSARTSTPLTQTDTNTSNLNNNPLSNSDPTINLFDTPAGTNNTTTTNSGGTTTTTTMDAPPTTTTTTLPPANSTAQACLASNMSAAQQWQCLNAQGQQGQMGPDAVSAMAASILNMMGSCGTAVRQEVIQKIASLNGSADQTAVSGLFALVKEKLPQCYYRVTNMQSGSLSWAPYQANVYSYNAGNIWNLMQGLQ